jgi:hypothetical protein
MNEQVRVIAKDGTFEKIKPSSELFVCGQSEAGSLREISAADLEVGEWAWISSGSMCNEKVTKRAGLVDVQSNGQPAEPDITDK